MDGLSRRDFVLGAVAMTTKSIANFILVLGQSNAMNYSTIGVGYPGGWTQPSLGGGYSDVIWNISAQTWQAYTPGTNSDQPGGSTAWGPEARIAVRKRAIVPQRATYILKYAAGGLGLAKTGNTDWSPYSDNEAWMTFCAELEASIAALSSVRSVVIDECYWIGNETDTLAQTDATAVMRDLPLLARAIRSRYSAPDMKFITVRCPLQSPNGSYTQDVRDAQDYTGSLRRNAVVDVDDFTMSSGHYVPSDVVTLGNRLLDAAEAITD